MQQNETILLILLIIFILLISMSFFIKEQFSNMNENTTQNTPENFKYYQCNTYPVNKSLSTIFKNKGIERVSTPTDANIHLTCGYTNVEKEYLDLPFDKSKYIHAIKGCDNIVSKNILWKLLRDYYGEEQAQQYTPNTYLLDAIEDKLRLLKNTQDNNQILILKKNLQRQEGLKFAIKKELTISKLNDLAKENYVIAQDYLDDPFIINGRKINLRVYLLIVIKNGKKYAYIYKDGFVYYTKKNYRYSTEHDEGITTGYIERTVYNKNPLTHSDLQNFLKKEGYNYKVLFSHIQDLVVKVLDAVHPALELTKGKVNYQLFGLDVQPDKNFNVKLLEINKGVSLQEMDTKDAEVKIKLQEDIYKTIGIIKENYNNDFVLVWKK